MTIAAWLFGTAGAILAGIGAYFILFRPAFLPEDLRFLGRTVSEIDAFVPQLRRWLRRVFIAFGGHALAVGGLTMFLAATAVRDGHTTAVAALALAGATSTGLMTAVNFTIRSDFRWLLLAVAALWATAAGAAMAIWVS